VWDDDEPEKWHQATDGIAPGWFSAASIGLCDVASGISKV
jgi:hypothetical protein